MEADAVADLLEINPSSSEVVSSTPETVNERLKNSSIDTLKLVAPIIQYNLFSSPSAYSLIEERSADLYMTKSVRPMMAWTRGFLKAAVPGVTHLGVLEL